MSTSDLESPRVREFVERAAQRRGAKPPTHLSDYDAIERREAVVALGFPGFRADQIARQWYTRLSDDPTTWSDFPASACELISSRLLPPLLTPIKTVTCDDGTTVKSVWRLHDGVLVESVLMRYPKRITMCVSSQVGCGMNCPFCATGQEGLTRNLSTAEIVEQVLDGARKLARDEIPGGPGRISNIVLMGMGEPLANYNSVVKALKILTAPAPLGFGMSARGITVSTVGLVPRIRQLAGEGLPATLAVSLHAPDDELRNELVPVNNRFPIAEVLDATWEYVAKTGRRASIEYAMIKDINDQAERADHLGRLLAGQRVHVNLIPLNPTPGSKWTASRPESEAEFVRRLRAHHVAVTVRDTRGREIDGACGQLAASTAI